MASRTDRQRWLRRIFLYPLQGVLFWIAFHLLRALPIEWASALGSRLLRIVGPMLRADRTARRNLAKVFPGMTPAEIDSTIAAMWDNLGRNAGEWAHVDRIPTTGPDSRVEIVGEEHLLALVEGGKPFITFSAHIGNWEIASLVPAQRGRPLVNIYRSASAPIAERLFRKVRGRFCKELIPKGRQHARRILECLKEGNALGLLVDQKLNEGVPIPFLGHDAMTPTVPADLALRFQCPLVPARVERLDGVRFRLTVLPPMTLPDTGDRKEDVRLLLTEMNALIGDWVRENPSQWFWVHRRWPD